MSKAPLIGEFTPGASGEIGESREGGEEELTVDRVHPNSLCSQ